MEPKVAYSTPMLHVADIVRSIRFYELLGFQTIDTEEENGCIYWARMHCEGGAVMFLLAEHPVRPEMQGILLATYTDDLPALRERLLAAGLKVPPIEYPGWMPSGHLPLHDPDGYAVGINHWGKVEHENWLKHLEERKKLANS